LLARDPQIRLLIARGRARNLGSIDSANSSVRKRVPHGCNDRRTRVSRQRRRPREPKHGLPEEIQPNPATAGHGVQVDEQRDGPPALQGLEQFGHREALQDDMVDSMAAQTLENLGQVRVAELFHHNRHRKTKQRRRHTKHFPLAKMERHKNNAFAARLRGLDHPQIVGIDFNKLAERFRSQSFGPK